MGADLQYNDREASPRAAKPGQAWARGREVLWVLVGLAVTGWLWRGVEARTWAVVRQAEPAWQEGLGAAAVGQGLTLGVLGGFRALAADMVWLRANVSWERREVEATEAWLRLGTTLDSRPLFFWLQGARMLAWDMPGWRIEAEGGAAVVPGARQGAIVAEQAARGLAYLEQARRFHPDRAAVDVEVGNLQLQRRGDLAAAAAAYRAAAQRPDAPYYAARLHAEMLRRLGRDAEALAWLRETYATLPGAPGVERSPGMSEREWAWRVEQARAEDVAARIRELEARVGIGDF
jgi:tetratricopeptide (TPR) repeat protein